MNPLTLLLSIAGLGLCIFGYWGMFTKAGSKAYDEMDGMYPFFAFIAGVVLLLIALIAFIVTVVKKKKAQRQ
jgi:hypothetical protein